MAILKHFFFIFLIALMISIATSARADVTQEKDKQLHYAASAGLSLSAYSYLRYRGESELSSYAKALLFALTIGVSKEVFFDSQVDSGDIEADILGASSGLVIPIVLDF